MAKSLKLLEAKFEQVLLYADGPQVVLLSSIAGSKVIGIAIAEIGYEYPFFAAQVSSAQFSDYLNEKFDLRYLLLRPDFKRNFLFDFADLKDDVLPLKRFKISVENQEKYLPDAGIFARDHTEKLNIEVGPAQTEQTFGVDGSWDLPEFSHFYSNVTDLYAFFNSIEVFLDNQASLDRKQKIRGAFVKPFEGGGSYVSLYDSLLSVQAKENRLHVDGISYNSPGYVRLRGFEKPFSEIKSLIANLEKNLPAITDSYNSLRGLLAKEKLLRMRSGDFNSNTRIAGVIFDLSKNLAVKLDVVDYDSLCVMAGENTLVVAKVLLSVYRRALRLYEFFLEGRVSLDVPTSLR